MTKAGGVLEDSEAAIEDAGFWWWLHLQNVNFMLWATNGGQALPDHQVGSADQTPPDTDEEG